MKNIVYFLSFIATLLISGCGGGGATSTPAATAPSAPGSVMIAIANTQLTPTWPAVSGAISYNIYYSTTAGVTVASGTKVANATSGAAITGLVNGTPYYVVVTAVNAAGESAVSNEVSATPIAAPSGAMATIGNGEIAVSWTSVTGATSYNVYYRTTAGVTIANGTKVTGLTSGSAITGLSNGTMYYFVITAVNAGGESGVSNEASATPQLMAPAAPTGISASVGNTQVTISWTAAMSATSYNVYYGTTAGVTIANGTKVIGVTSGAAITGLTNGTTYYFVVTGVNGIGEGVISAEVSAKPQLVYAAAISGGGSSTSFILKSDGTAWTLGGMPTPATVLTKVSGLSGLTAMSGGMNFREVFLKMDGTVWTWDTVDSGGSYTLGLAPIQVSGLNGVTAITQGVAHTLVLKGDGTVWGWGNNQDGELGNGTSGTSPVLTPVQANPLAGVVAIAAGYWHSVALKSDGTVWQWGVLGSGTISFASTTPAPVTGLSGITAIKAGQNFTLVLKSDGTVWAWGSNYYGSLGDGTTVDKFTTPVQVSGLSGVIAIDVSPNSALALKSDGTVWAWGENVNGQLGDGTTVNKTSPVQVSGLSAVTSISAGSGRGLAIKSDGTVWGWGNNGTGALGDGTKVNRLTPVQSVVTAAAVAAPTAVTATVGVSQVTLAWTAVTGATSYNVYWSTQPDVNPLHGTQIAGVASGAAITGLTTGTTYYFTVTSLLVTDESTGSAVVSAKP